MPFNNKSIIGCYQRALLIRVSAGQESSLFSYCRCIVKIESPALCVHENILILTFRAILVQQLAAFCGDDSRFMQRKH